jgi:endonuclease III
MWMEKSKNKKGFMQFRGDFHETIKTTLGQRIKDQDNQLILEALEHQFRGIKTLVLLQT